MEVEGTILLQVLLLDLDESLEAPWGHPLVKAPEHIIGTVAKRLMQLRSKDLVGTFSEGSW